jgi:hypothetical protein
MLRNGLLRDVDFGRDLADGARPLAQELQNLDPARFTERFQSEGSLGAVAFHKCPLV